MKSVVLVGMPGAGKSTVGVLLAKKLAMDFVDTDLLIQLKAEKSLQSVINEEGYLYLRRLEEQVLLEAELHHRVVATGGSAVYSDSAMRRLKGLGTLVYLQVSAAELQRRIGDYSTRGIACDPAQSFADIYAERCFLYEKHADLTIVCDGLTTEQVADEIVRALAV